jgi:hypothetical protein
MRAKLALARSTTEIAQDIKATMHLRLTSQNLTVMQAMYDRERGKAYNTFAEAMFPDIRTEFDSAIADLMRSIEGSAPSKKVRKVADNAWKHDRAADRRAREGSIAPYRGRPEVYDPDVVQAFANAIARVANRTQFATGHHGDATLGDTGGKGSPLFRVLVAAIRWAMFATWQSAAPPGSPPPIVKPEGILNAFKRTR